MDSPTWARAFGAARIWSCFLFDLKIRVTMTFRISQIAAVCGLSLLTMPGAMSAQAPRYQSPYGSPTPAAPQSQPAALPAPAAVTPNGVVVEDIIVRVNDQIISRSDLERSQQQLEQEMQGNNVPAAEAAEGEKNLLRDMIDKQLMLSRAKELGLNADAEVVRRLDEIRKQYKLDTMGTWRRQRGSRASRSRTSRRTFVTASWSSRWCGMK